MVKNVRALFTWPLREIYAFRVPKKDFDMKVPTFIYNAMCMQCYKFSHKGLNGVFKNVILTCISMEGLFSGVRPGRVGKYDELALAHSVTTIEPFSAWWTL